MLAAGFPKEQLFPRRGREINFTVDGRSRVARGEAGESAIVKVNGHVVSLNTPLELNADITIEPSTVGEDAVLRLEELEEHQDAFIGFWVNERLITCPRFFEVNGSLEPPYYEIQEGDRIETRSFYTVSQIIEFMDVEIDQNREIFVNNREADLDTLVYENFSIDWTVVAYRTPEAERQAQEGEIRPAGWRADQFGEISRGRAASEPEDGLAEAAGEAAEAPEDEAAPEEAPVSAIHVTVNGDPVILTGKADYIFVDIFDSVDFDLNAGGGRQIKTLLNGKVPSYTQEICEGDTIELYWQE